MCVGLREHHTPRLSVRQHSPISNAKTSLPWYELAWPPQMWLNSGTGLFLEVVDVGTNDASLRCALIGRAPASRMEECSQRYRIQALPTSRQSLDSERRALQIRRPSGASPERRPAGSSPPNAPLLPPSQSIPRLNLPFEQFRQLPGPPYVDPEKRPRPTGYRRSSTTPPSAWSCPPT